MIQPGPDGFGQVRSRPDRPGYSVRFTWDGVRYERRTLARVNARRQMRPIATEAEAVGALATVRQLLNAGHPAADAIARVFGADRRTPSGPRAFVDLAALYVASPEFASLRARTRGDYRNRLRVVLGASWARRPLSSVTAETIGSWAASLAVKGPAGEALQGPTLNRYLSAVSAVYSWARRTSVVPATVANPCRDVARRAENPGRDVYLEPHEAAALLEACDDEARPLVRFAVLTGLRVGALLSLSWRSVDLEGGRFVVERESDKAKAGYGQALSPDALEALRAMQARRRSQRIDGSDPVFLRLDGTPYRYRTASRALVSARARVASILAACATDDEGRARLARWIGKRDEVTFHVLRHTMATLADMAGVPQEDTRRMAGHRNARTTARYVHSQSFAPLSASLAVARMLAGGAAVGPDASAPTGTGGAPDAAASSQEQAGKTVGKVEAPPRIGLGLTDLQSATS